ncbi:MAG: DUF397 domain-containing protein [Pseudonocardiaceae bacterium]
MNRTRWSRSTYSGWSNNCVEVACVEVAPLGARRAVRDSKDPTGPALTITAAAWAAFSAGVCAGEFD